jgi:hypothetical protein
VISVSPEPNALGWNNTDVTVTLSASPASLGPAIATVTYALSGAVNQGPVDVSGASAVFDVATEGQTAVTFYATDEDGVAETPQTVLLNIDKTLPVVLNLDVSPNPVEINTVTAVTATIDGSPPGSAPLTSAEYRVDGGVWTPLIASDGVFDAPSETAGANVGPFTTADVKHICARATDVAGNTSMVDLTSAAACAYVAVFDPDAGFVTGGGWIDSVPAACPTFCSGASGRAVFGFISKYQKGAKVPVGSTEFRFQSGNLSFHSDVYEWLVVAGQSGVAQYKGSGAVNGTPGYGFLLTAYDADLTGKGMDGFRIKIWDQTGVVIYDNLQGHSDDNIAANTQPIGGGSVIIKTKK